MASSICACDLPASASWVFMSAIGRYDFAAAALKQLGPRILGFQKLGSPMAASQDRSTMQTKSLVPGIAISKPLLPRPITQALPEMDSGAALRARAISAFRSTIRY